MELDIGLSLLLSKIMIKESRLLLCHFWLSLYLSLSLHFITGGCRVLNRIPKRLRAPPPRTDGPCREWIGSYGRASTIETSKGLSHAPPRLGGARGPGARTPCLDPPCLRGVPLSDFKKRQHAIHVRCTANYPLQSVNPRLLFPFPPSTRPTLSFMHLHLETLMVKVL